MGYVPSRSYSGITGVMEGGELVLTISGVSLEDQYILTNHWLIDHEAAHVKDDDAGEFRIAFAQLGQKPENGVQLHGLTLCINAKGNIMLGTVNPESAAILRKIGFYRPPEVQPASEMAAIILY